MDNVLDEDLIARTKALLEPGEIELNGLIVHTELGNDQESRLHQLTLAVGDRIAEHADAGETYVYSGNDDPEFGLNQHQGLTLADDAFVWECQQLLRNGTFDVVFYYEATGDQSALLDAVDDIDDEDVRVTGVEGE
ncbi:DUF5778 family protein [Halocatena pleomorpha]|uniref:Uncharacterized protein n=1 Tax=Halocatena pleomorpha TaxID=1785090 RepID=A0A3P3R3X0_9EURY|nr:DUF5778 family protein [Halocatena pleomorpha]RRJ28162.1 hypothetical protein EIK79_16350 [Halocatena pleomorpha]